MQIAITVPIIVNDVIICEFEAAVDVKVLSYGHPAQTSGPPEHCDLGENPEWEVEIVYVDVCERNEEGKFVSKLVECPDELLIFVTQYIEGEDFEDVVCCEIGEADPSDYYEPDYDEEC